MNGTYLYFVNKLFLVGRYWDFNPFPNDKFKTSRLKEFTDNNFKYGESGRKFNKWLENTVGKGEIAHYEQFLLFQQCFQKTCTAYK